MIRSLRLLLASCLTVMGCSLAAHSAAANAGSGACRNMVIDGKNVTMCKDANGNWQQTSSSSDANVTSERTGLPTEGEVTYNGTYTGTISEAGRINPGNFSFGGLLQQAMNRNSRGIQGNITVTGTINNGMFSGHTRGDGGIYSLEISGPVSNGHCKLTTSSSHGSFFNYEGECGPNGFSGKFEGHSTARQNFSGQFDMPTVRLVDIAAQRAEQQRLAAERQAQAEEQRARAAAALAAAPNAPPALAQQVAQKVAIDSRGWVFNHFDAGSVHNVKVVSGNIRSGSYVLHGEYTYNGGSAGWVLVQFTGSKFDCIQFWDAQIGCRQLRTPEYGTAMRGAVVDAMTSSMSSDSSSGSRPTGSCHDAGNLCQGEHLEIGGRTDSNGNPVY